MAFGSRAMAGGNVSPGFGYPRELSFGEGHVWIGDNNNAIMKWTPDGEFVARVGDLGGAIGQFRGGVQGVDVANAKVYATDLSNCRIQIFNLALDPKSGVAMG